jgi:uncharacterized protein YodC (DUF2158 family)
MGDNSGSKASPQAPTGLGPTGYDPGRGALVQHRAGGPTMVTLNRVEGGYMCQYFDRLSRLRTDYVLVSNLVAATAEPSTAPQSS